MLVDGGVTSKGNPSDAVQVRLGPCVQIVIGSDVAVAVRLPGVTAVSQRDARRHAQCAPQHGKRRGVVHAIAAAAVQELGYDLKVVASVAVWGVERVREAQAIEIVEQKPQCVDFVGEQLTYAGLFSIWVRASLTTS